MVDTHIQEMLGQHTDALKTTRVLQWGVNDTADPSQTRASSEHAPLKLQDIPINNYLGHGRNLKRQGNKKVNKNGARLVGSRGTAFDLYFSRQ